MSTTATMIVRYCHIDFSLSRSSAANERIIAATPAYKAIEEEPMKKNPKTLSTKDKNENLLEPPSLYPMDFTTRLETSFLTTNK
jgi:hypothetical protein